MQSRTVFTTASSFSSPGNGERGSRRWCIPWWGCIWPHLGELRPPWISIMWGWVNWLLVLNQDHHKKGKMFLFSLLVAVCQQYTGVCQQYTSSMLVKQENRLNRKRDTCGSCQMPLLNLFIFKELVHVPIKDSLGLIRPIIRTESYIASFEVSFST